MFMLGIKESYLHVLYMKNSLHLATTAPLCDNKTYHLLLLTFSFSLTYCSTDVIPTIKCNTNISSCCRFGRKQYNINNQQGDHDGPISLT